MEGAAAADASARLDPRQRGAQFDGPLFADICSNVREPSLVSLGKKVHVRSDLKNLQDICFQYLVNNIEDVDVYSRFGFVNIPTSLRQDLLKAVVRARKVRSWHIPLLLDDSLYSLDLAFCPVTDSGLARIPEKTPHLRQLSLRECKDATPLGVRDVLLHCPELQNLSLSIWHQLDDKGLAAMFEPFKKHSSEAAGEKQGEEGEKEGEDKPSLKLQVLNVRDSRITAQGIKMIADYCPELEVLDLRWNKHAVTREALRHVLTRCEKLHSLDVGWCPNFVNDDTLAMIGELAGDRLRQLSIEMCFNVSDRGLIALLQKCPELKYLRIKNCKGVTNASADVLATCCTSLVGLELSGCFEIGDEGMKHIARKCTKLEAVSCVNVAASLEALEMLASHGNLRLLDVGNSDIAKEVTEALTPKGVHVVRADQTRQSPYFDLVCNFDLDYPSLSSIVL